MDAGYIFKLTLLVNLFHTLKTFSFTCLLSFFTAFICMVGHNANIKSNTEGLLVVVHMFTSPPKYIDVPSLEDPAMYFGGGIEDPA
jgi:hypothetical protein